MDEIAAVNGSGCRRSKAFRHRSGFVLAEILVVSVIVAILAAVAIPMYSGYVQNQRVETAKNIAQSTAAAANIFTRRTGSAPVCTHSTTPTCVTLLNIFLTNPAQYQIDINVRTVTVTDLDHAGISQSVSF